ncbi:MAG: thiamine phosphate synthase [Acidobacteria bacterium]|nr:thiamine phosphate synthase [Acidobacteriota bacterium]MBI3662865.1 thiamine phosphate synthase [Acidobacteriota bacterium]
MNLVIPRLYAIMDAALLGTSACPEGSRRAFAVAEALASAGVGLIQYRDKQISAANLLAVSRELVSLLHRHGARFVVNDRPDVAALAGAGGVHVGQEDVPVEDARVVCGRDCWVGISTHNEAQVREADATSADYIAVGPVFSTSTKQQADPVVGLDFVRRARAMTRKPLVAIGGITVENAEQVWRAGADSVAVARDLLAAADPALRASEYLRLAAQFGVGNN